MGNRIWLPFGHAFCKKCKKKVDLYEIYHIVSGNNKAVRVGMCSICFNFMWGTIINEDERKILNIFLN